MNINNVEASIENLSIHTVGNASRDEPLVLSSQVIPIVDEDLHAHLISYFTASYKEPKWYKFTSATEEATLNPVFNFVSNLFDDASALQEESVRLARTLYDCSNHPFIKSGKLMVARIPNLLVDDEMMDAIAIVKCENEAPFFDINKENDQHTIQLLSGIKPGKPDKACLVFNTQYEDGYRLLITDYTNQEDAKYWTEDFLNIARISDEYYATVEYIKMTKSFVKEGMSHIDDIDTVDELDIVHKTKKYFQQNEVFNEEEFKETLFEREDVKQAYETYAGEMLHSQALAVREGFNINQDAVKKSSKFMKSVIKLDKNFHIYCHGDKSKIEKGTDPDGRKYYKLYYEDEK